MGTWRSAAVAMLLVCAGVSGAASEDPDATTMEASSDDVTVAPDGSFSVTNHAELRATNEAGAMQASRISVFYDSETQNAEILEAHTLKKDGTKIPIDVSTIYEQVPADNTLAVTSFRVKVLLFPQFSAGDTAVYTVRTNNPKPMFAGAFQFGKYFPRSVAFKNAEVTIRAPKSLPLKVETHDLQFSKETSGDTIIYRWHRSAASDKKAKTALVSPLDREPRFFVSSFKDYGDLGRAYAAQSEPKAAVTDKIRTLAEQITKGTTDRREQARLTYEWVAKNIRYVAIELGQGSFVPHDADTVLARGYGDCKDHEVLLRALLKAKGIEAQGVLINGTNDYALTDAPSFAQLNHIITYLPEFGVYLDASVPVAPFGVLPQTEYGKPAVLAVAKGAGLVTLPMPKPGAITIHQATVQKIAADGTLSGTTTTTATGPYAIALRYIGYAVQAIGPEKAGELQMGARGFKDGKGKLIAGPLTELGDSYTIRGEYSAKGWEDVLKGESTIMPGGLRLLPVTGDGIMGPLYGGDDIADEPTVCIPAKADEDLTLELPAGYTVRFLPKDETVTTPNLTFTAHWSETAGALTVHREFVSKIDQPICRGPVRKQTAEALKQIAKKFDQTFAIIRSAQSYKDASAAKPEGAAALVERGEAFEKAGDHAKAIADFTAALAIEPDNAAALFDRGYSYDVSDQADRAIADYTTLIAANDNNAVVRANRGRDYARQNKYELALPDYERAVELDPENTEYMLHRAYLLSFTHKPDRAAAAFGDVIAKDSQNADAYSGRCAAYHDAKNDELALADCNKALALTPNASRLYLLRAQIRHALGDHFGGNRDVAKAAQIDPKLEQPGGLWRPFGLTAKKEIAAKDVPPMVRSLMDGGRALDLKDYDTAVAAFERAIKQGIPDSAVLPNLCVALSHTDRLADAAYQCSRALQLRDNDPSLLRARGLIYFRQAKYRDALADFEELLQLYPNDPLLLYERGVTRKKLGDKGGDADIAKATATSPNIASKAPKAMRS
ncbi:tetratricopeptide repeat protein [Rhizomicrobium electricum]|nr:tetratricopeptide repeat protein [Rhizomicrobium electricum]NIJ50508.1 tetratricopeptide (TPR) repeat protein/transglutaminase-like putative cysteine protease [Rhizomicrobium electricum]